MPKTSSSSYSSSKKVERFVPISEDDEKSENTNLNHDIRDEILSSNDNCTKTLKQKAILRMKAILHQLVTSENTASLSAATESSTVQLKKLKGTPSASPEEKASNNLYQLLALALTHPDYLKTESVLRLVTNEVEKQNTLENMETFLIKAEKNPPSAKLLTVLIKHQLKQALSQETKRHIVLSLGVSVNEMSKQNISKIRFQEINQQLEKHVPTLYELPSTLVDVINFSKKLAENQAANKMPPSALAFSLAPCLLPELKKSAEYHLTLLRFEIQLNTLLKLAFKNWILH